MHRGEGRADALQGTRRAAVGDKIDAPAIRFLANHRSTLHNEKRVGGVRKEFVAERRAALREERIAVPKCEASIIASREYARPCGEQGSSAAIP